jgi:hypothetical protein
MLLMGLILPFATQPSPPQPTYQGYPYSAMPMVPVYGAYPPPYPYGPPPGAYPAPPGYGPYGGPGPQAYAQAVAAPPVPAAPAAAGPRACTRCGASVTSQFCASCGAQQW